MLRHMESAWQRYLGLAAGLTEVTRKGAESVVKRLVASGEVASSRAEDYVEDLLHASDRNRKALLSLVRTETERTIGLLGLARQDDVEHLRERVEALEALQGAEVTSVQPSARRAASPWTSGEPTS